MDRRQNLIQIILLCTAIVHCVNGEPQIYYKGIDYTTNNGAITINEIISSSDEISIPSIINGLPVTSISDYARFFTTDGSVINLDITIPSSVTNIGSPCSHFFCVLAEDTLVPNYQTNVMDPVFWGWSVSTIILDPDNPVYSSVAGVLFNKSTNTLIHYPINNNNDSYMIPNNATTIGDWAFANCKLNSITIPTGVAKIGVKAFYGSYNLTSITIPNSVTSVGDLAFANTGLTNITIPSSVTNIGNQTFAGIYLNAITVDPANPAYCSVAGVLFNKDTNTLVQYPSGNAGSSYTIPDTVTNIASKAFSGAPLSTILVNAKNSAYCSVAGVLFNKGTNTLIQYPRSKGNSSYTIPSSVTNIMAYAFAGCSKLTNITIPNSVTNIGAYAFAGCASLSSIAIPKGITNICDFEFAGCVNLTSATFGTNITSIGNDAFSSCYNLTNFTLPNTVTNIGEQAFSGSGLRSVTITNHVSRLGDGIYAECVSLTNVIIGTNITSIGNYVFNDCRNLNSVTIPSSVTNIGDGVFAGCLGLTGIIIPNSITSLGSAVFFLTGLTNITIPSGVNTVSDMLFASCLNLTSLTFPTNVTSIMGGALYNCASLVNVTIAGGRIGNYAFDSLPSLASVTMTNNVTSIGDYAFEYCIALTNVTMAANITNIGNYAFYNCTSLTNIVIPSSVTMIGTNAFGYCSGLTGVTILSSATSIGDSAFVGCPYLMGVYFKCNPPSVAPNAFDSDAYATAYYYVPGLTGWGATFGKLPVKPWNLQVQTRAASFGVQNQQFGFDYTWESNRVIIVESCTNLTHPAWTPLQTNTLTGVSAYFSDSNWTNYYYRFYRLRSP